MNITTWDGNIELYLKQTFQMTKLHFSFQAFLTVLLVLFAEGSFCHGFSSLTSNNFFADNTFYAYRTNLLLGLKFYWK
jgi:hypothetical protein